MCLYHIVHAGNWDCSSYLARPLDAEQTRVLRHDAILFPTRRSRVRCQRIHTIRTNQVIRSEQESVSQGRRRLYARVVGYAIAAQHKNAPTLTESKQKTGGEVSLAKLTGTAGGGRPKQSGE